MGQQDSSASEGFQQSLQGVQTQLYLQIPHSTGTTWSSGFRDSSHARWGDLDIKNYLSSYLPLIYFYQIIRSPPYPPEI